MNRLVFCRSNRNNLNEAETGTYIKKLSNISLTGTNKASHNRLAFFYDEMMKTILKALLLSFFLIGSTLAFAGNVEEGNRLYNAGKYQEALTYFMKPDAATNPATMNRIGYMYDEGQGVKKDPKEAYKWYQKAAETGFPAAQFNLGLSYQYGTGGVQKNINEAVKWFLKAAEQNNAEAELKMGYLSVQGLGTRQDFKKAMNWFRRAAEHGDDRGYVNIGIIYSRGDGVKKDLNRAVQYYILGAQKGEPKAQGLLGTAYAYGKGITQNTEKALYWYQTAAKNGNINAMKELGSIYSEGDLGVQKDIQEAKRWNEMARKAEQKK